MQPSVVAIKSAADLAKAAGLVVLAPTAQALKQLLQKVAEQGLALEGEALEAVREMIREAPSEVANKVLADLATRFKDLDDQYTSTLTGLWVQLLGAEIPPEVRARLMELVTTQVGEMARERQKPFAEIPMILAAFGGLTLTIWGALEAWGRNRPKSLAEVVATVLTGRRP